MNALLEPVLDWYAGAARDLPWRRPGTTPWAVMVSEFMLQQTPVSRVLPVYEAWLERWPTPADLAAEPSGEAVRAWGRLGYPRRALRLHACAVTVTDDHGGQVPDRYEVLRALPGVGEYTAAAIASFAFGQAHAVLDTNVRRVLGRALGATEFPSTSVTRAERDLAASLVPDQHPELWAVAVMELGALVCTAAGPRCDACPIRERCAWQQAGRPAYDGPPRRGQRYEGTDRQCRGRILALFRETHAAVPEERIAAAWPATAQRTGLWPVSSRTDSSCGAAAATCSPTETAARERAPAPRAPIVRIGIAGPPAPVRVTRRGPTAAGEDADGRTRRSRLARPSSRERLSCWARPSGPHRCRRRPPPRPVARRAARSAGCR